MRKQTQIMDTRHEHSSIQTTGGIDEPIIYSGEILRFKWMSILFYNTTATLLSLDTYNRIDSQNRNATIASLRLSLKWKYFYKRVQKFFGWYQHFVEIYSVSCIQMIKDGIGNYILVQCWLLFHYYVIRWPCILYII